MAADSADSSPGTEGSSKQGVEIELKRDLGLLDITMIGLGPTIGSTIFLLAGLGIGIAGPALILAFVLNFIVTIFTAMAYAELGSAFADTGGGYMWVRDGMPKPFGFIAGWMSWFGHSIVTSFYVLGFGFGVIWLLQAYNVALPASPEVIVKTLGVAACLVFIIINYRGVRSTGRSSIYVTGALVAIVVIYIIAGLVSMFRTPDVSQNFTPFLPNGWGNVLISMGFTFIVFEGYEIIAQCGEECKDPEKNIPKASWICITIGAVIFILVAVVTIGVVGWQVAGGWGEHAVAQVAEVAIPGFGLQLIGIGIIIGTLTAINSTLFSSSRVAFAMGRDEALPGAFGRLHKGRRTPHVSIFFSGTMIMLMTVLLPIEQIAASADIMFLLLMLFVNVALITLRIKRPDIKRGYLVPLFPIIPIVGLVTKGIMAFSLFAYSPFAWYIALFWICMGAIIHYFAGGRKAVERIPAKKVELLSYLSSKGEVDRKEYRVLVPMVDLEDDKLAEFGAIVAREREGELAILNVVEVPDALPLTGVRFGDVDDKIKELHRIERSVRRDGIKTRTLLKISHKVSDTIIELIEEEDVNFLVLGWRGRHTKRGILGTNLDYILHGADCDVAVLKTSGMKDELKSILVFSGGGLHAQYSAKLASMLARLHGARVVVLSAAADGQSKEAELRHAEKLVEICRQNGVEPELKVLTSPSVITAVKNESFGHDLLVAGASPVWKIRKYAFGPILDKLCKEVDIPVLMVRRGVRHI